MSLSCGTPVASNIAGTTVTMTTSGGAGGTGPYTYQWYRSTTTDFSPGSSNLVSGATGLVLNDSGLLLGVKYYYVCVVTDTGNDNATANSDQTGVQLLQYYQASPSQNAFAQSMNLGKVETNPAGTVIPCIFDPSASGTLTAGQAVIVSTSTSSNGGVPMVMPSTAASDVVLGFVAYDFKSAIYNPGDRLQIASWGSVQYLCALGAVPQGTWLISVPSGVANGGVGVVTAVTGSSGYPLIGYAYTTIGAASYGRVYLMTPNFAVDTSPLV